MINDNDRKLLTQSLENFAAFSNLDLVIHYDPKLDCSYFRFARDPRSGGHTVILRWEDVVNIAEAYEYVVKSVNDAPLLKSKGDADMRTNWYDRYKNIIDDMRYDTKGETKMNTVNMLYDLAQSNKRAVLKTSRGDIPVEIGDISATSCPGCFDDISIKCNVVDLMGRSYKDVKPIGTATKPTIKNVIFNNPATIVFWTDGTKTVVKAQEEEFDPEKGLAMAIVKKTFGNRYDYYNTMAHWLKKYKKKEKNNHGTSETV